MIADLTFGRRDHGAPAAPKARFLSAADASGVGGVLGPVDAPYVMREKLRGAIDLDQPSLGRRGLEAAVENLGVPSPSRFWCQSMNQV